MVVMSRIVLMLFFLTVILHTQTVWSEESQWVEVVGETISFNLSEEEARLQALRDARTKALYKAVEQRIAPQIKEFTTKANTFITTGAYTEYFNLFPDFIRSVRYGRITEEQILEQEVLSSGKYQVRLKAQVTLETVQQPMDFRLDVEFDKPHFNIGDNFSLTLKSNQDCYVTIINIQADGTMTVLFPSPIMVNNFLKAGEVYQFPPPKSVEYLLSDPTTEMILVIATRDAINFSATSGERFPQASFPKDIHGMLLDLSKWLATIPPERRTLADTTFEVIAQTRGDFDETDDETGRGQGFLEKAIPKSVRNWLNSSNNVAVVIGIDDYQNKNLRDLHYAVSDAKAMSDLLQQQTTFEIYRELYNEQATKVNILDVVDNLSDDRSIDRIIFYFSGHGWTQKAGTGYQDIGFFLPVDGDKDKLFSTAIPMGEVRTWAQSLKARHVLFIFDACFSGIVGGSVRRGYDYNLAFLAEHKGRHVITAGTKDDEALEYNHLRHGALTYYFLQAIETGEADVSPRDGVLTLNELEGYLQHHVSKVTDGKQHPKLIKFFDGDGELFIELKE